MIYADPLQFAAQRRRPRLTTRSIFELAGSTRPGRRLCPITTPLRFVREYTRVTSPVRQCLLVIIDFAVASCFEITLGTLHRSGGGGCGLDAIENVRERAGAAL